MASTTSFHDRLVSWIARKGFVWGPSPELYNGLAGFYDYAPLGKLLKNNVEKSIRELFVKHNFWEVECPIISPKDVWEASGHLGGFTDPVIKDKKGNAFRADNLVQELLGDEVSVDGKVVKVDGASCEELLAIIQEHKLKSPTGVELVHVIEQQNLMLKTIVGQGKEVYNRPETATTTYLPFTRYVNFFRDKLPFGVFQIGKAFRNEISPRQHVLRQREFTQAEGQLFLFKEQKNNFEPYENVKECVLPLRWYNEEKGEYEDIDLTLQDALQKGVLKNQAYSWTMNFAYELFKSFGLPPERLRIVQHEPSKRAFYAEDAWDIEVNLQSFGWMEMCGVHDRTDYDLTQHSKHSKQSLSVRNESSGEKETPHIIEIAFGTDRPTFALMDVFWSEDAQKNQEVFRIPAHMAPVSVAFFPLVKKGGLPEVAKELYANAQAHGLVCVYDDSGSVGRRYARMDEIGTPYCVTVDFDTVEKDGCVTVRHRDTTEQVRMKKEEVVGYVIESLRR